MPVLSVIGLFFGKAGKAVLSWLSHASLWQLVSLGLGILVIVQHFQLADARHDRDSYHKQRDYYHSELTRTISKYTSAQADAKAKNLADVARIEARQKEITDEKVSTLNSRLQLIDRELRAHPDAPGATEQPPISQTGYTPCRAFDPAWLCLSPADRLRAAQNEERHDQLIDWTILQSAVGE